MKERKFNEHSRCDEIDLLEMWKVFVQQRKIVLGVTFLFVLVATVYAFWLRPVFRVQYEIWQSHPVYSAQLSYLSGEKNFSDKFLEKQLLLDYLNNLNDNKIQHDFIEHQLKKNNSISRNSLTTLSVKLPKKLADNEHVIVSLDGEDSRSLDVILDGFLSYAKALTLDQYIAFYETQLADYKLMLNYQLDSLRWTEYQKRQDSIVMLTEARIIAQKLGIIRPYDTKSVGDSLFELNSVPLYFRGVTALNEEIAVLTTRSNDDAFITDLRELQAKIRLLDEFNLNTLNFEIAQMRKLGKGAMRIGPRKVAIIAIGLVAGFLFGLLGAFGRSFLGKVDVH